MCGLSSLRLPEEDFYLHGLLCKDFIIFITIIPKPCTHKITEHDEVVIMIILLVYTTSIFTVYRSGPQMETLEYYKKRIRIIVMSF